MNMTNKIFYFPDEIINEILSKLPVNYLLRFKCVCKSWHKLINSQEFIKYHLKNSKEINSDGILTLSCYTNRLTLNFHPHNNRRAIKLHNPTFLDYYKSPWNELPAPILVGSANGLVCFALPHDRYVLYNPSTRAFKEIPKVARNYCHGFRMYSLLMCDRVNDDFKVFELFIYYDNYRLDNILGVESLIFSMKSNLWKTIDIDVPYYKNNFVVTNDSLCWVDRNRWMIRSFDFSNERYEDIRSIPISNSCSKGTSSGVKYRDFDILIRAGFSDLLEFALWETYRWTVLPIICSKYGKACEGSNLVLGWSDLKDAHLSEDRFLSISGEKVCTITAKPWVESLVFPD